MERTKVGTVEQLKLSKRPWEGKRDWMSCRLSLRFSDTRKKDFTPLCTPLGEEELQFQIRTPGFSALQICVKAEINQGQETMYVFSKREVFLSASLLGDRHLGKHTLEDRTLRNIGPSVSHGPPSLLCGSGTLPQSLVCVTSARRTTRLPSGQMTWSTWERTRSHVSSGVRRLVWKEEQLVRCGSSEMQTKAQL